MPESSKRIAARRARLNAEPAGKKNFLAGPARELVHAFCEGDLKLADLKPEELPEDLRKLSKDELEKELKTRYEKRQELQKKILELSKKRQAHIEAKLAEAAEAKPLLEVEIFKNTRDQAAKKGIGGFGGAMPAF
jgi:hypothetical protein